MPRPGFDLLVGGRVARVNPIQRGQRSVAVCALEVLFSRDFVRAGGSMSYGGSCSGNSADVGPRPG